MDMSGPVKQSPNPQKGDNKDDTVPPRLELDEYSMTIQTP